MLITLSSVTKYFKILLISFILSCTICYAIGLYIAFFHTPDDYLQKELVKILYIHVPAAWLSILFYILLALCSIIYLATKNVNYDIFASVFAEVAIFTTTLALITGAIWGKPAWGTYWVWDARLTAMFIQFLMLLSYIILRMNMSYNNLSHNDNINNKNINRGLAMLAILGLINIPIIKFSVKYWNTLHQTSTFDPIMKFEKPNIDLSMIYPLPWMFLGLVFFCLLVIMIRLKNIQLRKKIYKTELQQRNN